MNLEKINFKGWENCLKLSNGEAELVISVGLGPRILSYRRVNGVNFMKNFDEQLADIRKDEWQSYGGHRLWHAPEVFPRTYYPDVEPVKSDWNGRVLRLQCVVESTTGLQKEIEIELAESGTEVKLCQRIFNRNPWAVTFAPWGLSVMAPGGTAIVPQEPFVPHGAGEGESFEYARPLVLWKFTNMADPRFVWGEKYIRMRQDDRFESKQKFGGTIKAAWAGYALDKEIFLKHFEYDPNAIYPDGGCNAEFFTMPGFLEIESLGPLAAVEPGAYSELNESWRIVPFTLTDSDDAVSEQLKGLI